MATRVSSRTRTTATTANGVDPRSMEAITTGTGGGKPRRNRRSPRRALFASSRGLGRVVKHHLSSVTSTSSSDNGETEAYIVDVEGVGVEVEGSERPGRHGERPHRGGDEGGGGGDGDGHTRTTSLRRPSSDDDGTPDVRVVLPIVEPDDGDVGGAPQPHPHRRQGAVPPPTSPAHWPQRPLLLRAAPDSGTVVRGVRHSGSSGEDDYLPEPPGCFGEALPINDGSEAPGRCLVVDFGTELFEGTAMLRIRGAGCAGAACEEWGGGSGGNNDGDGGGGGGYFGGRKRRFQAVVRGRFRRPGIPMDECITGQLFDRPAGRLPGTWVLRPAVGFVNLLSPNLHADFGTTDPPRPPRFLSPLVPTAQTISSRPLGGRDDRGERHRYRADGSIESEMTEPADESSLLFDLVAGDDDRGRTALVESLRSTEKESARIRARKNAYNRHFGGGDDRIRPTFRTDREYTFEFFQHLLVFAGAGGGGGGDGDDDGDGGLAVDLGSTLGRYRLAGVLDGQPLKFMAAHRRPGSGGGDAPSFGWLWSFEIWHESLYSDARRHADASPS